MKSILLFILVLFIANTGWSSPQKPDLLIIEGDTVRMYNLILEEFLGSKDSSEISDLFGYKFRNNASFNCWRGYQAVYTIDHDSLFLSHIISCSEEFKAGFFDLNSSNQRIEAMFPQQFDKGVFLNWYSGRIDIPLGDLLRWDGIFYGIPSVERSFQIENGLIAKDTIYENYVDDITKLNRRKGHIPYIGIYLEFKNNIDWSLIPKDDDYPYLDLIVVLGEDGYIDSVACDDFCINDDAQLYIDAIRKALTNMPAWDIILNQGTPISETFYYSHVRFDSGKQELSCSELDYMIEEAAESGEPYLEEK